MPAPEKASPEKTPVSPSEAEDEDPDEYDDEEGSTSFFKPMLGLAAKAVGKLRGLGSRKKETEEFLDDSDDGYEDEEPLPEKKGPFRLFRRRGQEEEDFGEYEQDEAGEESEAWQRPAEEAETEEIPQEEDVAEAPVSTPEEAADQAETEGAADIPDLPEDVPFEAADAPAADPDGRTTRHTRTTRSSKRTRLPERASASGFWRNSSFTRARKTKTSPLTKRTTR